MRLRLLISTILIGCCLSLTQGCSPEKSIDDQARSDAKDESDDDGAKGGQGDQDGQGGQIGGGGGGGPVVELPPVVATDPIVVPVPVPPPPPFFPPVGGGGSQGAIRPVDRHNGDHHNDRRCGNGIQEPDGRNGSCPFDIYGTAFTDFDAVSGSSLVGFNVNNGGAGTIIAPIGTAALGCDVRGVSAVEFSPDGTLYGIARMRCGAPTTPIITQLVTLSCQPTNGVILATVVGNTYINTIAAFLTDIPYISDLDFDSHGRLYAYVKTVGNSVNEQLGTINILTGLYTPIGFVNYADEPGGGLASLVFPDPNSLYQAGTNLHHLDVNTGTALSTQALIFPAGQTPADIDPRVRAMDRDPLESLTFVNIQYGAPPFLTPTASYLGLLDRSTATVSYLNPAAPIAAPTGLRGITVNRRYETCDRTDFELPPGTHCSSECTLIEDRCDDVLAETICSVTGNVCTTDLDCPLVGIPNTCSITFPGIDNNFNGLANCADPDCLDLPCNALNGCVAEARCASVSPDGCVGLPIPGICESGNECAIDTCVPNPGDITGTEFSCEYSLDTSKLAFGSCTPTLVGPAPGFDNCSCARNPDGTCPASCIIDLCIVGHCAESLPRAGALAPPILPFTCVGDDRALIPHAVPCVNDLQCGASGTCFSLGFATKVCGCTTNANCPGGTTCDTANGVCVNPLGCDDGNECTTDGCIVADVNDVNTAICINDVIDNPNVLCNTDGELCTAGHCIEGNCSFKSGFPPVVVPDTCLTDADCGTLLTCTGAGLGTCSISTAPCVVTADCPTVGDVCVLPEIGVCSGSPTTPCTLTGGECPFGQTCTVAPFPPAGVCSLAPAGACATNTDCPAQTCTANVCSVTGTACATPADCAPNNCLTGVCSATVADRCLLNATCPLGEICVLPTAPAVLPGVCACDDGQPCTAGDSCVDGACTGGVPAPNACDPLAAEPCGVGSDLQCVVFTGTCTVSGNPCIVASPLQFPCDAGQVCTPIAPVPTLGVCQCRSVGLACQLDECVDGVCTAVAPINGICGTESLCLTPLCTENGCENTIIDGAVACVVAAVPPSTTCFAGTAICVDGVEDPAGCVANVPAIPVACPLP